MVRLKEVMLFLANDAPHGVEWLDNVLTGDGVDLRECRIGGDLLLVYQVENHLQAPQKKFVEILTADTLACHRDAGLGSRIRERLERRQSGARAWTIARRKHD